MLQEKELDLIEVQGFLDSLLKKDQLQITKPKIALTEGTMQCIAVIPSLKNGNLFHALTLIKKQIPNIKIDNIENQYLVVRDLGENIYQPFKPLEGLRIRIRQTQRKSEMEMSKKGNYTSREIYLMAQLLKYFYESTASDTKKEYSDPLEELEKLDVIIQRPKNDPNTRAIPAPPSNTKSYQIPVFPGFVGYQETRKSLYQNVILPITHPLIFQKLLEVTRRPSDTSRLAIPRAILFEGEPGVGKTTVARNLAQHSRIPLIQIPIEKILSKYYGESESNLTRIFDLAAQCDKVILFIDELDALGISRADRLFEATRRILSVLLTKLDGFNKNNNILTIGATNRKMDLDPALLSRFDTTIFFNLPDEESRKNILHYYAHHLSDNDLEILAKKSQSLSGRDIENICIQGEREWAHHLIQTNQQNQAKVDPPPLQVYLNLLEKER